MSPTFSHIEQQFLVYAAWFFSAFIVSAVLAHLAFSGRK